MKDDKDTFTLYGHKRDVLAIRHYIEDKKMDMGGGRMRTVFRESRFRLILDGGETYDAIYQPELSERYKGIAKPVSIERAPDRRDDVLIYPQGERFPAYGGTLTTYDEQDLVLLNAVEHSEPAKPKAKRKRKATSKGGMKPRDGEKTIQAARDALAAMRKNPHQSLKGACIFQVKEHGLTVSGRAVERHARKIRKQK